MTGVIIVGIVLSSVLIAMGIIAATIVAIKRPKDSFPRLRGADQKGETQMIQELHDGLLRMEKRVEALETILLERERKERVNESA
ncbi:MAG: phage-shock protein [Candidatus Abyssobacteria bacterium SURF_5]|uniref:Phage-shock protein n=1 Tax=Abyssobacteria bacterium (strain SURF_5) TaxID=2093360 RepID=A0A3A4NHY9_ABYX5|nr:MAG: phage-shock protein [Candidatus Abyssubacteria bacterium SURF_5]